MIGAVLLDVMVEGDVAGVSHDQLAFVGESAGREVGECGAKRSESSERGAFPAGHRDDLLPGFLAAALGSWLLPGLAADGAESLVTPLGPQSCLPKQAVPAVGDVVDVVADARLAW